METPERSAPRGLDAHVTEIVSCYLRKNQVAVTDLPYLITTVYQSLQALGKVPEPEVVPGPAVPIRRSVHRDYVVCLDCGWRGKTLRRHIADRHDLSVGAYKAKWKLLSEHPITAPAYSQQRSKFAKQFGLGNRRIGDD